MSQEDQRKMPRPDTGAINENTKKRTENDKHTWGQLSIGIS